MTSFIIQAHVDRPLAPSWTDKTDSDCSFCRIIHNKSPAFKVYENDKVVAFLVSPYLRADILPLRKGHTLVVPKVHYSRLSELPLEYAAAVGQAVSRVAHALTEVLDNTGLNVVCNQEYAQAVPHVHYHIIPAPKFGDSGIELDAELARQQSSKLDIPITRREMHQKEFESRQELDPEEAEFLQGRIRSKL